MLKNIERIRKDLILVEVLRSFTTSAGDGPKVGNSRSGFTSGSDLLCDLGLHLSFSQLPNFFVVKD